MTSPSTWCVCPAGEEPLHLQGEQYLEEHVMLKIGLGEQAQELLAALGRVAEQLVEEPRGLELVKLAVPGIEDGHILDEIAQVGSGRTLAGPAH